MSTMRSSSERPRGTATAVSQMGRPRASSTATALPLARPVMTKLSISSGEAVPRSDSTGTERSNTQRRAPVAASSAVRLPSTDCTTTRPLAAAGTPSTSLLTWLRQTSLPSRQSSATTSASLPPTRIRPSPVPTPPVMWIPVFTSHSGLPLAASKAATRPS